MYIFDIDGTLSIMHPHRRDLLKQPEVNWTEFFNLAAYDTPNQPIVNLCRNLQKMDRMVPVCFMTGRPERIRGLTTAWLAQNGLRLTCAKSLWMRPDDDHRPDYVIKEEAARPFMHIIDVVFEDRTSVVEMWRRNGVTCCQVSDFEEIRKEKI